MQKFGRGVHKMGKLENYVKSAYIHVNLCGGVHE